MRSVGSSHHGLKIGVAEIQIETNPFKVGQSLMIQGPTTGVLRSKVESMQIEHKDVPVAIKGKPVAVKLGERVRPGDRVFLLDPFKGSGIRFR